MAFYNQSCHRDQIPEATSSLYWHCSNAMVAFPYQVNSFGRHSGGPSLTEWHKPWWHNQGKNSWWDRGLRIQNLPRHSLKDAAALRGRTLRGSAPTTRQQFLKWLLTDGRPESLYWLQRIVKGTKRRSGAEPVGRLPRKAKSGESHSCLRDGQLPFSLKSRASLSKILTWLLQVLLYLDFECSACIHQSVKR